MLESLFSKVKKTANDDGHTLPADAVNSGAATHTNVHAPRFTKDNNRYYQVLSADKWLASPECRPALKALWQNTRTTQSMFDAYYQPVISRMAELVQGLYASQNAHHAYHGGLLFHTLEVTQFSLQMRKGIYLPEGMASYDVRRQQEDLWTYYVFCGAVFHDLGKVICNHDIFGIKRDQPPALYHPLSDPPLIDCFDVYSYAYRQDKYAYHEHERVSALLADRLIPAHAKQWLESEHLYIPLLNLIAGHSQTPHSVYALIKRADIQSAKQRNISKPTHIVDATKTINKLIHTALKHTIDYQFSEKRDEQVLFAVENLLIINEQTLNHLHNDLKNEFKINDVSGHPIEDRAQLIALLDDLDWVTEPNLIHAVLDNGRHARGLPIKLPKSLHKDVTLLRAGTASTTHASSATAPTTPTKANSGTDVKAKKRAARATTSKKTAPSTDPDTVVNRLAAMASPSSSANEDALQQEFDAIIEDVLSKDAPGATDEPTHPSIAALFETDAETSSNDTASMAHAHHPSIIELKPVPLNTAPLGERFFTWLQEQISSQALAVNEKGAKLHMTTEGLGLVTPSIFVTFANLLNSHTSAVQNSVFGLNQHLVRTTKDQKTRNVVPYKIKMSGKRLNLIVLKKGAVSLPQPLDPNTTLVLDLNGGDQLHGGG